MILLVELYGIIYIFVDCRKEYERGRNVNTLV